MHWLKLLYHCLLVSPKCLIWQTVNTQMKYHIIWISLQVIQCNELQEKDNLFWGQLLPVTPFYINNGPSIGPDKEILLA